MLKTAWLFSGKFDLKFILLHAKLHLLSSTIVNVRADGVIIRLRVDASTLCQSLKLAAPLGTGS